MVLFEQVNKVYPDGTEAVKNLDLEVAEGEVVVLIGPSGCGKTTTLKMVNRLEECSKGTIFVEGQDINAVDVVKLRRSIGYVIQEIALMPHMSVAENIAIVPKMLGWNAKKIQRRVDELLEMAGLNPAKYRYHLPDQLSGGQKQRIGVLRAMAADPRVILMDEPFGALDPISREKLQNEFLELQKNVKKTIIFVTHDMDEALKMADRIVLMRQGKIEQVGSPAELQDHPANDFVRSFIGEDRLSQISPDSSVELLLQEPLHTIALKANVGETLDRIEDLGLEAAQVVSVSGKWHGMVTIPLLKKALRARLTIKDAVMMERKLYIEDASLRDAAEMLGDLDLPVPVLDNQDTLLGVITEAGLARLTINRLKRRSSNHV